MSLDPSLKSASSLVRHRNVLKRSERIERLAGLGKWDEKKILGLPKVANRKMVVGGKAGKEEATAEAAGTPAAPAAGKAAAAAPAAKAAAPAAKGGKK